MIFSQDFIMNVHRVLPVSFSGPFGKREIVPLDQFNSTKVARVVSALNHKVRIRQLTSINELFEFWFNRNNPHIGELFTLIDEYYKNIGYDHKQLTVLSLWSNFELMNLLLGQTPDNQKELSM